MEPCELFDNGNYLYQHILNIANTLHIFDTDIMREIASFLAISDLYIATLRIETYLRDLSAVDKI